MKGRPLLRFGTPVRPRRRGREPSLRSVWMLLLMLGAVLALMNQVSQPRAVRLLGRLFAPAAMPPIVDDAEQSPDSRTAGVQTKGSAPNVAVARQDSALWEPIKDNAMFLTAEQPAWFALLDRARGMSLDELAEQSVGDVAYAQLLNQPDAYRGQSVRVSGRVLRESSKPAPNNDLGIDSYHQLTLAPRGGGDWPIIVYVLNLPDGFPRGDGLHEDLTVNGLFFKNWSYPHEGGMGLAPVVVAPTVRWTPPVVSRPAAAGEPLGALPIAVGGVVAAGVAALFVGWTLRQTGRRNRPSRPLPDRLELESKP